ncbi:MULTISPECIES: bifunctional 4-hydroxy-2-oxoglutarate aldolase/2-dehydro-3-deoxy-phosphogluconate aldolase [unclassified Mycobacterium]|uniref:bifunctional 4-hydroxy-2-oxoglutarate aldolase/2-dehydro-3-deoxy-phosphogluconate aldolase n=1 Tax=unclassified Mycobacterium TaxID=2642494 RepID=UPI0029C97538|nr:MULTISPECIES: bifunctional 4-hydroxy-2-oxoglutarate aldolase/2-dehydro-3-deoxy-phosphogluconate aldolase [unclassified Mycobacterium]
MTEHPKTAIDLMNRGPVIPVVVLDHAADAVPLARALLAGGVDTMEITLRTPEAIAAIAAVAEHVPDMAVGAGTIIRPEQARHAVAAGATFLVSPGCSPRLLAAMLEQAMPILPGAVTASEVLALLEHGVTEMKFFPAAAAGGVPALRALAGPLPDVTFCPTGGIDRAASVHYLALPNVACVGGSWLAPTQLVAAHDWDAIIERSAAATAP